MTESTEADVASKDGTVTRGAPPSYTNTGAPRPQHLFTYPGGGHEERFAVSVRKADGRGAGSGSRQSHAPPRLKPVLNWANVCSPEHTSETSTNYDSFLN